MERHFQTAYDQQFGSDANAGVTRETTVLDRLGSVLADLEAATSAAYNIKSRVLSPRPEPAVPGEQLKSPSMPSNLEDMVRVLEQQVVNLQMLLSAVAKGL